MNGYLLSADLIVAIHCAYVSFVVVGQLAILIGWPLGWRWIRNPWLRAIHFTMITIVVVETLLSYECPLTAWERELRAMGGAPTLAQGDFVGRMASSVVFWLDGFEHLTLVYYAFGATVLSTMLLCPPRFRAKIAIPADSRSLTPDS
jgi:hypothetical protein